jgi:cyclohexanone monooxygenase
MTGGSAADLKGPDFDVEALRAKYRAERDKRLRADGKAQYVAMAGKYAWLDEDPYAPPGPARAPLADEVEVAIIGGGFSGLLAGARLREAGFESIRLIERAADLGGTWYWNRYPGIGCDIESYTYLPLLEETGYMPTHKYAFGPEIQEHHRRIARHYDLYRDILFQTEVTRAQWDEDARRWTLHTDRGDAMRARFLVLARGPMTGYKLAGIPGLDDFKGKMFHTARWDYAYTGGDSSGGLANLADKDVAIIGTGASAVQAVPHLGAWARRLHVFQRTPSSIDIRNDHPTDPAWAAGLEPGWHQKRLDNFNALTSGVPVDEDLVNDGWTEIFRNIGGFIADKKAGGFGDDELKALVQLTDFRKMEQVRARVDAEVKDPAVAAALKPWYNQFCKRPCFHDEYLATFNRPNVTLVDTDGRGVERITENAVVANGQSYRVDCIIFATGFDTTGATTVRSWSVVNGVGGRSLRDHWSGGVRTMHGLHIHGFPNCFNMGLAQSALSANYVHVFNEQAKHIAYVLSAARDRQSSRIEVDAEGEAGWVAEIRSAARQRQDFLNDCTPGYYNNEGMPDAVSAQNGVYGAGPVAYIQVLEDWRAEGGLAGLQLS